jgi:diaminopimelate decarboxylase
VHHFSYQEGRLCCEQVDLTRIADEVGTPVYVYSKATLTRHARVLAEAPLRQMAIWPFCGPWRAKDAVPTS